MTLLLLDLDDTIFPTRSIPPEVFAPLFRSLNEIPHPFTEAQMQEIYADLWKFTFHEVAEKYQFSTAMRDHYMQRLGEIPLNFDIRPYPDYTFVKTLGLPMILVTSGTTRVQECKIDALGIRGDFEQIWIDDRNLTPGGKHRIFKEIMERHSGHSRDMMVIGDNFNAEIRAARDLEIPWLWLDRQRPKNPQEYRIQSLQEIHTFL